MAEIKQALLKTGSNSTLLKSKRQIPIEIQEVSATYTSNGVNCRIPCSVCRVPCAKSPTSATKQIGALHDVRGKFSLVFYDLRDLFPGIWFSKCMILSRFEYKIMQ
jgi:hypothetical protein